MVTVVQGQASVTRSRGPGCQSGNHIGNPEPGVSYGLSRVDHPRTTPGPQPLPTNTATTVRQLVGELADSAASDTVRHAAREIAMTLRAL